MSIDRPPARQPASLPALLLPVGTWRSRLPSTVSLLPLLTRRPVVMEGALCSVPTPCACYYGKASTPLRRKICLMYGPCPVRASLFPVRSFPHKKSVLRDDCASCVFQSSHAQP